MISVFIPAFNEEKNLADSVRVVSRAGEQAGGVALDIIIVNDGSSDRTAAVADALAADDPRIRVIHQPMNRGVGAGFLLALELAKYPKFIIIPGDNDITVELLSAMLRQHDKADVVLSYFLNKEMRGRRRNVLSTVFNTAYMVTFNVFIQYVNGPAIYPIDILRRITFHSLRHSIPAEATIKVLRTGCSFCEVGGYMQMGLEGSSSFNFKNLIDALTTYAKLVYEIHVAKREQFSKRPRRVPVPIG